MRIVAPHVHTSAAAGVGFGDELFLLRGPSGVTDQSSSGNDGTYNGGMGVVADTDSGGVSAFSFDGSNDYISFASGLMDFNDRLQPFTMAAWIKIAAWETDNVFAAFTVGANDFRALTMSVSSQKMNFLGSYNGSGWGFGAGSQTGSTNLSLSTWYLAAWSRNSSGVCRVALNGASDGTFTMTNDLASFTPSDLIKVGSHYSGNASYMANGRMDDVRLLDRELSLTELSDWHTAGRGYNE